MSEPLVVLESVGIRYGIKRLVREVSLSILPGESWAIVGGNGAGKTVLTEAIAGLWAVSTGSIRYPGLDDPSREIQIVSFEAGRRLLESERRKDDTNILHGATDPGTSVREYLLSATPSLEPHRELLNRFALREVLDRGLRYLSTGELRKTLLCRGLLLDPRLLILDDPYDGLDASARDELSQLIHHLTEGKHALVVVLGRLSELPRGVDKVCLMHNGRALYAGAARDMPELPEDDHHPDLRESLSNQRGAAGAMPEPLIQMKGVDVSYGEKTVLRGIDWEAWPGEVWHIVGPNGSGKTTLLSLIDGSNPKAYGQDLRLFGRLRGTGESVWEIKQRIGHVSADFHKSYPLRTTALETVLSGFSDSAGLYEEPSGLHVDVARQWLGVLDLAGHEDTPLRRLSYGQQRSLLVARAMVKMPPILIADEPTQGLDDDHSALVLSVLERIGTETQTLLLYVSHDPAHNLRSTSHRLILESGPQGSEARIEMAATPSGPASPASPRATTRPRPQWDGSGSSD